MTPSIFIFFSRIGILQLNNDNLQYITQSVTVTKKHLT